MVLTKKRSTNFFDPNKIGIRKKKFFNGQQIEIQEFNTHRKKKPFFKPTQWISVIDNGIVFDFMRLRYQVIGDFNVRFFDLFTISPAVNEIFRSL